MTKDVSHVTRDASECLPVLKCNRPNRPKNTLDGLQFSGSSACRDDVMLPSRRENANEGDAAPRSANDVITISSSSSYRRPDDIPVGAVWDEGPFDIR